MGLDRFVLRRKGFIELLTGPPVRAELTARGQRVLAAAGRGHRMEVTIGKKRVRVAIITVSFSAMHREAKDRNLTRAIDAAR